MPTRMGVRVSPTARSTVPKRMLMVRNSMGAYRMRKYIPAASRISGATCIHLTMESLSPVVRAVNTMPTTSAAITDWAEARLAFSSSPAPKAWEM